jgi:hypothetical protein
MEFLPSSYKSPLSKEPVSLDNFLALLHSPVSLFDIAMVCVVPRPKNGLSGFPSPLYDFLK